MRSSNMNWVWMSGLALCVLAALLYFMMQSDFMKKQAVTESVATENVATSIETEITEELGVMDQIEEENLDINASIETDIDLDENDDWENED